jgi:acetyltransferase-like isoleucine patch superfamily enzyme
MLALKRSSKGVVFGACVLIVAPLIAGTWLEAALWKGERIFLACAQLLAVVPSHLGVVLRAAYYFATLDKCSWETSIGFGSLFTHRGAMIGPNVSTGVYCVLGHVNAGANVMFGSRVSVPSGKRQHFDAAGAIVADATYDTVTIGAGSWIGEGAIVLAAVGRGTVVSAGAVVTSEMPDNCIVGGNPAKVLRTMN